MREKLSTVGKKIYDNNVKILLGFDEQSKVDAISQLLRLAYDAGRADERKDSK